MNIPYSGTKVHKKRQSYVEKLTEKLQIYVFLLNAVVKTALHRYIPHANGSIRNVYYPG